MANKVYEVPADWAKAADLIGGGFAYDTSKKYVLQCNGSAGETVLLESATRPSDDEAGGFRLKNTRGDAWIYEPKEGEYLYVRKTGSATAKVLLNQNEM
ncbi:MAG: hypothetical protein J5706_08995 [Elusimicrobiales bacterium]|nr:hypothetical protein [Elusimicrobiales bacterium]